MSPPADRGPAIEERTFHAWLRKNLISGRRGPLPLGDDVAVVPIPRGARALLTTDALSEGTHFLRRSPPEEIGAAVVGASLSDVAAKGGVPVAALIDLLVPPGTPARWAEAVLTGAERMATRYRTRIVGGDTKPAAGRTVVGTVLGVSAAQTFPGRHRARPGDRVVVTGHAGGGGVRTLPALARRPTVRELRSALRIVPRLLEGALLAPLVRAMTDTSDGIAEASSLIAEASRVSVVIEEAQVPWDPGLVRFSAEPTRRRAVGFFGGDYELFATIPPHRLPTARRRLRSIGTPLTVIGEVRHGRGAWLTTGGGRAAVSMPKAGWDPFRRSGALGSRRSVKG